MSSTDGFCSTLAFNPGDLGSIYDGPHPTHTNPIVTTTLIAPPSQNGTPLATPTGASASPSLTKASPVPISAVPSHPSPSPFSMRPGSPTRSNSQSSVATMASVQTGNMHNAPTPSMGHVPLVTATDSAPPTRIPPMSTPPQTPMSTTSGHHSASNSISGSVLGKREPGASESEKEESKPKKRRVAPTLVQGTGRE